MSEERDRASTIAPGAHAPLGRKRDQSLDSALLEATLDVLAEVGAAGLTIDAVAARAGSGKAALYRRWSSKSDLIIAAISSPCFDRSPWNRAHASSRS
jgi:AcrR family transcriptional regulator